jgi:hypothetical protein
MAWRLAAGAERLRDEVNALFPDRDKASDGSLGDQAHAQRDSDHNPDENGIVHAIDIDEDFWGARFPDPQIANTLVRKLIALGPKDKRLKYIIFEGFMWSAKSKWQKQSYAGSNMHNHHIHVSFTTLADDDDSPYGLVQELKQIVAEQRPIKKAVKK